MYAGKALDHTGNVKDHVEKARADIGNAWKKSFRQDGYFGVVSRWEWEMASYFRRGIAGDRSLPAELGKGHLKRKFVRAVSIHFLNSTFVISIFC